MAKSLRDRILEALKKRPLTLFEIGDRVGMPDPYVRPVLLKLKDEGLIKYELATEKWHLKRR